MRSRLITLSTDFGYKDPFVGTMKGVILGINPDVRIIDLTHGIPPQDLTAAALVLRHSVAFFPRGTIHVAVVDPGVGTFRRPVLAESEGHFFIGPDNGIISFAIEDKETSHIIHLCNDRYHLKPTSATFHGRDIFAPVAAHLSLGTPLKNFGTKVESLERLDWPVVVKTSDSIQGRVVYVDHFGNLITNIDAKDLEGLKSKIFTIFMGQLNLHGLSPNYSSEDNNGYAALINSWGLLEISLFKGNAQLSCGAKVGDRIDIKGVPAVS
jgi:S-adenosylmethionine hydrolase